MAENELQQSLENSNRCPICLDKCQELKTLNCQHSFCIFCLQNWMTKKGALECPNCRKIHPAPEGGLQNLPSNVIGELTAENFDDKHDPIKCCCGKGNADFYCQDCSKYLCTSCKNTHDQFPALKNHILKPTSATWPEVEPEPLCSLHEKVMEFYCKICKIPVCQKCVITDHKEDDGQHEAINVSDAFNYFRVTANALVSQVDVHKLQAQAGISKCTVNASELSKRRKDIIEDINNSVEEIVTLVKETAKPLKEEVEEVCEKKKKKSNAQIDELKSFMSCVEDKQNAIAKLSKSRKVNTLQTFQQAITELQEQIANLPEIEPRDDGKVYFVPTKDYIMSSFKRQGLGNFFEKTNKNVFEIVCENPLTVTSCQTVHVEIALRYKCKIDIKDLTVSKRAGLQKPIDMGNHSSIVEYSGKYFVKGSFSEKTTLDVKFCNSPIKGSPIRIDVQQPGIISNIGLSTGIVDSDKGIQDLVMSENGWYLVICNTDGAFRFENSGAFVSKIEIPSNVQTVRKLKNNNLIFLSTNITSTLNNDSYLTVCNHDGKFIKSISHAASYKFPIGSGIDVNEDLNLVYAPDPNQHCVHVYNMESKLKEKTIGKYGGLEGELNKPSDVAVTKEGSLIVADTYNHRLQLFSPDGKFIKVLIGGGDADGMVIRPSRVGVDYDDNIIVASECKVQLFGSCGKLIRVIHKIQNKDTYFAFSIVTRFPRRLALAEINSRMIQLINY
ncbi:E3 ubiquitin-protein ligase TRIM71-like [Anneissia japonica]|uniref:E3 ubiquitin-protein ligase TRIM71-like n=1 Tax=Anneissia japonica TaxID=1529436 RepID=UPI00142583C5|nr:E3 ubiquitin-protein ligase TRIM71-like [Anneissia japonica]